MLRTACFFIALVCTTTVNAQQLPLETYTPANGLVSARVNKMFQDSRGHIYFLTNEGFSIFDGQRFENYGAPENNNTEIFNDITEYKDGSVKLFSFDGNTYTISHNKISFDSSQKKLLVETNKIFDIGNGEKLIATNYFLLKEKNGRLQQLHIALPNPEYPGIENAVLLNPYLVFSTTQSSSHPKIYVYNYETQQLTDSAESKSIPLIAADKSRNIFFYNGQWQQLNAEALAKGKLKAGPLYFQSLIPANFSSFGLQFDNDNNVWLTNAEKGYCQLNVLARTVKYFSVTQGILSGCNFVFHDMEKNYWFVSSGSGVQKLQRSPLSKITTVDNTNLNFVSGISTDESNSAFINASGGLFFAGKKIAPAGLSNRSAFYWQDQYWNFSDYKTLVSSKGIILHLDQLVENYVPLDFQTSYPVIDNEGRMLIAGKTVLLINKDYSIVSYKLPYFCDNIICNNDNTFLCFLRSNYVIGLSLQNNSFKKTYYHYFETLNARYAIKWSSNSYLVGSRLYGVCIVQWLNGELKITGCIDKKNGLSNNFVNVLLKKDNNHLLAGTASGLDMISFAGRDTIIENLSARNNIFSSFINLVPVKDSSLLCQTLDGQLFKLENAGNLSAAFLPSAYFKNISVNSETIDAAAKSDFSYLRNNFNFSISAPSFLDNRNTRFRFVLRGNGRSWEQNNSTADFQINNLLPGTYQLIATVQYPGKFYPDQQLQYAFVIQPPFWKQWWFILLSVLLAVGIIIYIIRYYYRRQLDKQKAVLEKELAIEQERTRLSRELHDGLGSMLSGIKHSFSAMKNQLELNEDQDLKFHENIDKLNESIKELRNISHSMASDSLLKYGLENSLSDYCRNISEPGEIQVSFAALHTEQMQPTEEQTFHIFRIVQELLQNVMKHAHATHAIVQISYNAKRMYLTVEDDGNGFDMEAAKRKNGMGLKNIETRVRILKGRIDYQTSKGTSVMIEIPCAEKK